MIVEQGGRVLNVAERAALLLEVNAPFARHVNVELGARVEDLLAAQLLRRPALDCSLVEVAAVLEAERQEAAQLTVERRDGDAARPVGACPVQARGGEVQDHFVDASEIRWLVGDVAGVDAG